MYLTYPLQLGEVYKAGKKVWMGEMLPEDEDAGNLAMEGRVMEMLSGRLFPFRLWAFILTTASPEHTVEGWLEGYILSGRHGLLNSYGE